MKKEKAVKTEKKKNPLSKKQKEILFGVVSFASSFVVTTFIILTFAVFIPQGKTNELKKQYNAAVSLLNNGEYDKAASRFKNLTYDDSKNLYYIAKAGQYFNSGDYESGIQSIHDAGGSVDVRYDPNGGTVSNNREVLKIKKKWVENDPKRNGYDFIKWNISSFALSYNSKNYDANLNLLASWNILNYSITYNLNGGSLNELTNNYNAETPTFKLGSPIKKGYTFIGWSGTNINDVSLNVSIEKGSTGDRTYTANYTANQYTITYDYGYGGLSDSQIVTYDVNCSLLEPSARAGYEFNGWYYNDQIIESGIWNLDNDVTLLASWSIKNYHIIYDLNGGESASLSQRTFTYFDEVVLCDAEKKGYEFDGWYLNDTKVEKIPAGTDTDVYLEARWIPLKNELTVTSQDINYGTVSIQSGSGYSGEEIVVNAEPSLGYMFLGWNDGTSFISNSATYSFKMPSHDYSLIAYFIEEDGDTATGLGIIPTRQGNTVTYGLYPNKHVSDSSIIASLEESPIDPSNGWTIYNNEYYCKSTSTYNSGFFYDGEEFTQGSSHWFKCKPIKWTVFSTDNSGWYVMSTSLLDTHTFKGNQFESTQHKANYEESDIREWLNNEFLHTAFGLSEAYLRMMEVDNGVNTTDANNPSNCCANTFDKVWLGSYQDFYKMGERSRMCSLTDFALTRNDIYWAQGMVYSDPSTGEVGFDDVIFNDCYAPYYTRSPYANDANNYEVWHVDESGNLSMCQTAITFGVRPCVYIAYDMLLTGYDV